TIDKTSVTLDNAQSRGQTEAGALARLFGGKERIKYLVLNFLGNSRAGVRHLDKHIRTRPGFRIHARVSFVENRVSHVNAQFATVRHGVTRVDTEIQQDLLELRRVADDGPEVIVGMKFKHDRFGESFVNDLFDFARN